MRQARAQIGMVQSEDGLLCRVALAGAGPRPGRDSTVIINLSAKAPDGVTDLPQLGGQRLKVKVADMLPGLAEGVQMLAIGARAIFIVPPKLSFGDGEWPSGVGRGTPILFMLELEDIVPSGP
jgi:FKBP-type peptidyl-prolyl cis-trans isomerase